MMERNIQLRDGRILRENDLQDISVVGGGSINQTEIWIYGSKNGSTQKSFVKRNQNANVDFFECEVRGLKLLRSVCKMDQPHQKFCTFSTFAHFGISGVG